MEKTNKEILNNDNGLRQESKTLYNHASFRRSNINKVRPQQDIPKNIGKSVAFQNKISNKGFNPMANTQDLYYTKTLGPSYPRQRANYQNQDNYNLTRTNYIQNKAGDRVCGSTIDNFSTRTRMGNYQRPFGDQVGMNQRYRSFEKKSNDGGFAREKIINFKNRNNYFHDEQMNYGNYIEYPIDENRYTSGLDNQKHYESYILSNGIRPRGNSVQNWVYGAYTPKNGISFHKTQVFNNYKPFMVDEFLKFDFY